ncbi:MAG: Phosphoenolpyruvate synthase [Candidatus Jorgensenbacteria bacterium GW2011_GWA1_48_11]|uniref:Phosphoenolpyruvate synthase n=1 Tax=Candidatus Jorgensenbacteria bacterium GW2011_GWA1_48_11 TaxID=1618660 RepID=A0A0G1WN28_9BACT|nr:MAG: Phosphoenolpyruvate synthase [Candidatus Jorgensenbacteria bacterium GW2011_GWA1_48_11]KKW12244.1 MAG: Phosphoenolpyruvate synthase [Candidatus Jorgensenbacteria bacterium GW2011_GWB1_49_9]
MKSKSRQFILWFKDIRLKDVALVGGKNAALGEMYGELVKLGVNIPNGFALTAAAYRFFLKKTGLDKEIREILKGLDTKDLKNLQARGQAVRQAVLRAELPRELTNEIKKSYKKLEKIYGAETDVAVRSSATAEDLPGASFAGQQETYLNVRGLDELFLAVKKCIASLFTDRAISYRADKGFGQLDVALSVGIQKMVRSDLGASGVTFTIDTESGFDQVIVIDSIYGLGEYIVQGKVVPDEFVVWKPGLEKGLKSIIATDLGKKNVKLVYGRIGTKMAKVSEASQNKFSLKESEVLILAKWSLQIEKHFSKLHRKYTPMDIEWAKDGKTKELFIVQARPETVHALESKNIYKEYRLSGKGRELLSGIAVGNRIGSGKVRVILDAKHIGQFKKGEVLVTKITDPDWEPIMKIASAIVTDEGGRTSHAAIVSRELGIPCIVGAGKATRVLKTGGPVTVDCSAGERGRVFSGLVPFHEVIHRLDKLPRPRAKIMVNIAAPDEAFKNHHLPVEGVGLGRLEFIIASHILIHPNALLNFKKLKKGKTKDAIEKLTAGYADKTKYYVDELAEGIAKIAAAFWPHPVIIRFSDFKTNEYATLLGGEAYEPKEENPMLGFRGASRYYDPKFEKAFGLEVKAMKKVREAMGLTNVIPMIPFCRTPEEGEKVIKVMAKYGLKRNQHKSAKNPHASALKVYVMAEIPSNILLADEFLNIFDGMSIGSNDLTQLVLGLDRDSGIVTHIANENNPAVRKMIAEIIAKCKKRKKYIGICGQAPSDYPDFAAFLVKQGIESISLNPDTVIKNILALGKR